ncbi:hypothetical protein ILUMI_05917 [Ignelater luminosus]|uniref:Mos1 transposase HTH domain-containing protein n=1 Tax=Ignelater luminosus TaxID=2038154 RepID=A0A8K0GHQ1_IGNLU|nr:hypothetical protein ILUMI_05917 [Ignelater luminosus]
MERRNEHFRHILLFYFRKRKKTAEAHKEICKVYGFDCLPERTCHNWFRKFHSGDFSLKDEQRFGRPIEVDDDQIKVIIEKDRHKTVREIAERLNVSHTIIEKHLKCLGLVKKLDIRLADKCISLKEYKNQRNLVKEMIASAKEDSWKTFGEKLEQDSINNQKLLKSLRSSKGHDKIEVRNKEGVIIEKEAR